MIYNEETRYRIKFVVDVEVMMDLYTKYTILLNKITEDRNNLYAEIVGLIDLHMPGCTIIDNATGVKFGSKCIDGVDNECK